MSIFDKYAKLRAFYPEQADEIARDEEAVKNLLALKEYALLPETRRLIELCSKDILQARVRLATDRDMSTEARAELWKVIDARKWFLEMVAQDYDAVLAQMDRDAESELARVNP